MWESEQADKIHQRTDTQQVKRNAVRAKILYQNILINKVTMQHGFNDEMIRKIKYLLVQYYDNCALLRDLLN